MKINKKIAVFSAVILTVLIVLTPMAESQGLFQRIRARRQARATYYSPQVITTSSTVCDPVTGICYEQPVTTSLPQRTVEVLPPVPQTVSTTVSTFEQPITVSEKGLRRSLLNAVNSARKKGDISARDAIKIRVASFSPAFMERAEDLCVTQMAMSGEGSEFLTRTETGEIDRTAIDWDGFAGFLERIIPLLLELLRAFGL